MTAAEGLFADYGIEAVSARQIALAAGQRYLSAIRYHFGTKDDLIVALLAQWGGAQLVMALTIWVVLWRYRGLVPLMIAASLLDNVLRIAIGLSKPLVTAGTPPGALSWVVAPLCAVMLVVALMPTQSE